MKRLALKNYPYSVPSELPELERGLLEEFELACQKFQDQTAFVSFNVRLSYQDLYAKSCQFSRFLQDLGMTEDSVMALLLPNLLQYPVALWGSLMAGLKILNLNPLYTSREMLLPLKDTQAEGIVLLPHHLIPLEKILDQSQLKFVIVTQPGDLLVSSSKIKVLSSAKKHVMNLAYKYKTKTYRHKNLNHKNRKQCFFLSAFENPPHPKNMPLPASYSHKLINNKSDEDSKKTGNHTHNLINNKPDEDSKKTGNSTHTLINNKSDEDSKKTGNSTHTLINNKPDEDSKKTGNSTHTLINNKPDEDSKKTSDNTHKLISNKTLLIQYTGGTTGVIKGACLSERNILSNAKQCQIWMKHWLKESQEVALAALPLHHIFSFTVNGLSFFLHGFPNVLVADPRHIPSLIRTLKKQKVSVGTGVNTLFKSLLAHKNFKSIKASQLKTFVSGGMSLDPSVREEWESITKGLLLEGYGLTEASPVICVDRLDNKKDNSAGYPLPSTKVRIVNKSKELAIDEIGELEVKGPQVMLGYYQQEEETKKVLSSEGWLKTGDLAKINSRGAIEILGRKKELINISGVKVYPREVEELLSLHPKIKEVAIVGRWNERSEEILKAYIIKKQNSLSKEEVLAYCKENLAPHKIPKKIYFKENLEKNAVGKILKRVLE